MLTQINQLYCAQVNWTTSVVSFWSVTAPVLIHFQLYRYMMFIVQAMEKLDFMLVFRAVGLDMIFKRIFHPKNENVVSNPDDFLPYNWLYRLFLSMQLQWMMTGAFKLQKDQKAQQKWSKSGLLIALYNAQSKLKLFFTVG